MAASKKPTTTGSGNSKKPASPPAYGMGGNPTARSKAQGNAYGPSKAAGRKTPTTKPPVPKTPQKRTGR